MADDWEKEVKPVVIADKWEGEDSDDDVKDNWDDEDEAPAPPPVAEPPKVPPVNQKKKKLSEKIAEKERKEREERMESKPKTPEELLAEKLERQRLQEESDLLLAKEAFGDSKRNKNTESELDISLDTREDFDTFRKALVDKLLAYDKSVHYVNFLDNLFRELCVSIEADDIKRINGSLTALFNEKVKAQKAVTKGKKKQKGVSVKVDRPEDMGYGNNDYDDFDDFI